MKSESAKLIVVSEHDPATRNPFDVMDVPNPNDDDVTNFARNTVPEESAADENAKPWSAQNNSYQHGTIEGQWSSRWKGATDPTIPGDAPDKWKQGQGEARIVGDRVYLLFDWDSGATAGTDRRKARRSAPAGREIYQPEQPGDHSPLGRPGGERSENRRLLPARPGGFRQVTAFAMRLPCPCRAAQRLRGLAKGADEGAPGTPRRISSSRAASASTKARSCRRSGPCAQPGEPGQVERVVTPIGRACNSNGRFTPAIDLRQIDHEYPSNIVINC